MVEIRNNWIKLKIIKRINFWMMVGKYKYKVEWSDKDNLGYKN